MKRLFCLFIICLFFVGIAKSQYFDLHKGISVRKNIIDYQTFRGKDVLAFRDYVQGMEIAYLQNFGDKLSICLPLGAHVFRDSLESVVRIPTFNIGGQAQLHFFKNERWINPYLVGGVNLLFPKKQDLAVEIPLGAGLNFMVHPQAYLQWQTDFRLSLANWENHLQHHIGFVYLLGNKHLNKDNMSENKMEKISLDSDGDGIPDDLDLCPSVAGLAKFLGCPDKDGDGIEDQKDKCPDMAGVKELSGCPDSDADGVSDTEDECPNVKGVKSNKGCPEKEMKNEEVKPEKEKSNEKKQKQKEDKAATKEDKKDNNEVKENKEMKKENEAPIVAEKKNMDSDSDGDGVPDKSDLCPDKAGLVGLFGCPDSDGDGISDKDDKCPNVAGTKAKSGCPDEKIAMKKDADNDGIDDDKDDCPFTAGIPLFKGCPDSDGDGVQDKLDDCPNTYGPSSNKGCPLVEKKDRDVLEFAMRAVQFDLGKSALRPESFKILDQIAAVVKKYPEYNLSISGHTDNDGSPQFNLELSEKRAKVCYEYLISKGLSSNRLSYIGYGATRPIADNKSKDGKFLNRRTEFNLVGK